MSREETLPSVRTGIPWRGRQWAIGSRRGLLWVVAMLTYGAGDVATTLVGIALGAVERHALAAAVIAETSLPGAAVILSAWKLVVLLGFYAVSVRLDGAETAVPLGLAVLGCAVVTWNGVVVATLLFGG